MAVRASIADALSGFDAESVKAALGAALSDPSPRVRASAAHSLGELHLSSAAGLLRRLSGAQERRVVREAALGALARLAERGG